jgi:hypothetical protein
LIAINSVFDAIASPAARVLGDVERVIVQGCAAIARLFVRAQLIVA